MRELKGVPRQLIYRLLRKGNIRLNGKRAAPSEKLAAGDRISLPHIRTGEKMTGSLKNPTMPERVYEDQDYYVFEKPAGLAVHGGSGQSYGLIEAARQVTGNDDLDLAHRLDKDTSGLLVVARSRRGLGHFNELLRDGKVKKTYLALVKGKWADKNSRIMFRLKNVKADKGQKRSIVSRDGAKSETRCHCKKQLEKGAFLQLTLVTGKTHQARVHLAEVGNPIVGDARYGDRKFNREATKAGSRGLMLHAAGLSFTLPRHKKPIVLNSPLPDRFEKAKKWLGAKGASG